MLQVGPLLKAREVAERLQVDVKTVYAWINSGKMAHLRTPTNYIRIPAGEVDRFLTELKCGDRREPTEPVSAILPDLP